MRINSAKLDELINKYGIHPDIDEIFYDICDLAGEKFEKPTLDIESDPPEIKSGKVFNNYPDNAKNILNENFFISDDELEYFCKKYDEEYEKQQNITRNAYKNIYKTIVPLYQVGAFNHIGKKTMHNRIYQTNRDSFFTKEDYNQLCNNTIWGKLIESGPRTVSAESVFEDAKIEWLIKEEIFDNMKNEEAYDILLEACTYYISIRNKSIRFV